MPLVNRNPVFLFFTREKGARAPTPALNCLKSTFLFRRTLLPAYTRGDGTVHTSAPVASTSQPRAPSPRATLRSVDAHLRCHRSGVHASLESPAGYPSLRSRLAPPGARRVVGQEPRLVGLSAPMIRQRRQSADDLRSGDGDDAPAIYPPATIFAPAKSILVDRTQPIAFHKNVCHCSEAPFSGLVGGRGSPMSTGLITSPGSIPQG